MALATFELTGDVNVRVVVTELGDGTLKFDLTVLDDTGSIGDLNGLFFDISDDALVDGLSVKGDDITDSAFNANRITKVDGYNNVNGDVAGEYGKFDGGVQFGTSGIAKDDIRETGFILSHGTVDLTLDMILSQDFAVRLTSVGEEDGSREDSLKIGGEAPDTPDNPTPDDPTPDDPTPDDPTPDDPTPDEPTPDDPTPDDPTPDDPTPDQPAPDEPAPDQPAPDEPAPDQPAPDQPAPDQPAPDEPPVDDPVMEDDEFVLVPDPMDPVDDIPMDVIDPDPEAPLDEPSVEDLPEDILMPKDFIPPIDDGTFG